MDKHFFDTVRPMFGKLTQGQVDGCNKIIEYAKRRGTTRLHLAYVLGTTFHETAAWMQPIREGARRYGPAYSHASAIRAVTAIFNKGIIRRNYALPAGPWNKRYYGRGLVQITWYSNYAKFGIAENPDKALEWDTALDIMFRGMEDGMFTGKGLDMIESTSDYYEARAIVNGDKRKNGRRIANEASTFYAALKNYEPHRETYSDDPALDAAVGDKPTTDKKEAINDAKSDTGGYAPAWWPFRSSR